MKIIMRTAMTSIDALLVASAIEKCGSSVFSIISAPGGRGFIIWAKLAAWSDIARDDHLNAIDREISGRRERHTSDTSRLGYKRS